MTKDAKRITISDELYDLIKVQAAERHMTAEEYVEWLLKKALTR